MEAHLKPQSYQAGRAGVYIFRRRRSPILALPLPRPRPDLSAFSNPIHLEYPGVTSFVNASEAGFSSEGWSAKPGIMNTKTKLEKGGRIHFFRFFQLSKESKRACGNSYYDAQSPQQQETDEILGKLETNLRTQIMAMPLRNTPFKRWSWFAQYITHSITSFDGMAFLCNLRQELFIIGSTNGCQCASWKQACQAFMRYKAEWLESLDEEIQAKKQRVRTPPPAFAEYIGRRSLQRERDHCIALRDDVMTIVVPTQEEINEFDGNERMQPYFSELSDDEEEEFLVRLLGPDERASFWKPLTPTVPLKANWKHEQMKTLMCKIWTTACRSSWINCLGPRAYNDNPKEQDPLSRGPRVPESKQTVHTDVMETAANIAKQIDGFPPSMDQVQVTKFVGGPRKKRSAPFDPNQADDVPVIRRRIE
ncbi:uncharacterized protein K452DRAFT_360059 [Aplosporella prunicola CBS 121167]|uniref:Uncharacterized protein n=1 Tax=Aplosporella prunicola CBS 121167 TaxID=1176127 RepID=A0A6A6B715_9PEZI|nr:uncharacterized protein K452DRAFT_360059 [Aplosporella prunicola CBS 121167]KAF2139810.1 hypothetical protein K452DRAFT_360059 [Aplosporella prunicola CBS 121167]